MANHHKINIEVIYASIDKIVPISLQVDLHTSVLDAIKASGILIQFPEINLNKQKVGIFSKLCALSDEVKAGDRVEIYRPLTIDPKEARRRKAVK